MSYILHFIKHKFNKFLLLVRKRKLFLKRIHQSLYVHDIPTSMADNENTNLFCREHQIYHKTISGVIYKNMRITLSCVYTLIHVQVEAQ